MIIKNEFYKTKKFLLARFNDPAHTKHVKSPLFLKAQECIKYDWWTFTLIYTNAKFVYNIYNQKVFPISILPQSDGKIHLNIDFSDLTKYEVSTVPEVDIEIGLDLF